MTIVVALLVALVGVLLYFMASNPKLVEVGLVMFATGLLAFLLQSGVALQWVGIGAGHYR